MLLVPCTTEQCHKLYVHTIGGTTRYYEKLSAKYHQLTQLPLEGLTLVIDFSYCKFLNHVGVAFLGGLVRFVESRQGKVIFDWETLPKPVFVNLAQNGFLSAFGHGLAPWQGNSIPYRCDLQQDTEGISDYLEKKWLGRGLMDISPQLQEAIISRVWEIYLNAFTHGRSTIGVFSCGQYYPKLGKIGLTIVDFGVGIPCNVRSVNENTEMSSVEALKWAFIPGNSTIRDHISRGGGLTLLHDFIAQNQGELTIFSNDAQVSIVNSRIKYAIRNVNFSGTLVNIMFRCDESHYCLSTEVHDLAGRSLF